MAEAMPLVVVGGTVHCLLGLAAAREDCFSAGGLRLRLCPLQALNELEQDYWRTSYAQLDAFKVNYLRQVKGEELGDAQQTQRDVLTFLVCEMIPYLRSLQVGDRPAVVEKTGAVMPSPQLSDPTPCRLLQDWIGPAALILDQYLYRLAEQTEAPPPDALWVRVGRRKYVPERATAQTLAQLEEGYLAAVQNYLEQQAQGEVEERRKAQGERKGSSHEVLAYLSQHAISLNQDCTLYDDGDFAILCRQHIWYVCQHLAEYVVEDADGSLYRFDATLVGLPLGAFSGKLPGVLNVIAPRHVVVLSEGYEHMFVPQDEPTICLVKGSDYYQALRQMPLPQAICELLQANTGVLRFGHNSLNENSPHRRINTFQRRRITRAQAEANQLPIIPYRR
jgi:hypothetical protein